VDKEGVEASADMGALKGHRWALLLETSSG